VTTDIAAPTRVLLVEDAESFVDALVVGLQREGFDVSVARDGVEALEQFDEDSIDLVLLDVMLPRMSGIDVCRTIRAGSDVPIIMVTAKSTELDTVVGLEVGADDYVAKPYRLRELVSRMRAVLRRGSKSSSPSVLLAVNQPRLAGGPEAAPLPATSPTSPPSKRGGQAPQLQIVETEEALEAGGVRLDIARHECTVRGDEVRLPLKEFELLAMLLASPGRVLTRDTLIDRVWGLDYVGDTKTLDVHIKRLRARIEEDPAHPVLITTIRGVGYRFEAPRH
jgi:two-component system, OmpR family, response regulator RegX3